MIKSLTRACFLDNLLILLRILVSICLLFSHIESDVLNFWTRRSGNPLKVGVFRRPMKRPRAWCAAEDNGLAANPTGPFPALGGRAQNSALSCPPQRKFTRCCHVGSWQDTRNSDVVLGPRQLFIHGGATLDEGIDSERTWLRSYSLTASSNLWGRDAWLGVECDVHARRHGWDYELQGILVSR